MTGSITFAYHHGDEAVLKAIRQTSSTTCQTYVEAISTLADENRLSAGRKDACAHAFTDWLFLQSVIRYRGA